MQKELKLGWYLVFPTPEFRFSERPEPDINELTLVHVRNHYYPRSYLGCAWSDPIC